MNCSSCGHLNRFHGPAGCLLCSCRQFGTFSGSHGPDDRENSIYITNSLVILSSHVESVSAVG